VQRQPVEQPGVEAATHHLGATHHDHVAIARGRPGLGDRRFEPLGDEGEVEGEPDGRGRGAGDHEERRPADLVRAVAHLVVPTSGAVDDVEQGAAHHHRTRLRGRLLERCPVGGVVAHHPGVDAVAVGAEPRQQARVGAGHEAVHRDADVADHCAHAGSDRRRPPDSSEQEWSGAASPQAARLDP
jgi:hypothetical protein